MKIVLITDTFPPIRTSGAVQLRDLSREFARQGHELSVLMPHSDLRTSWQLDEIEGFRVLRLKAPRTKEINYFRRTLGELIMPFAMWRNLCLSPLGQERWDGVLWYSPSIFHGFLVRMIKTSNASIRYLILRDIFPEWAVDMGLMRRGLAYRFFEVVARYQYSVADVIGVQSAGNCSYFESWKQAPGHKLEVLQNWLGKPAKKRCTIRVSETPLAGRNIFVYAGNMGVAQGTRVLLDLAEKLIFREDIGFLFVGRGSDSEYLKNNSSERGLKNVLFFDEIDPDEIPDLYSQCSVGIVTLDSRHKSHNIPGKFLTYMQCGLPVLANVNAENDLIEMIKLHRVGHVCETNDVHQLVSMAKEIIDQLTTDLDLQNRCRALFDQKYSVERAVDQILVRLSENRNFA